VQSVAAPALRSGFLRLGLPPLFTSPANCVRSEFFTFFLQKIRIRQHLLSYRVRLFENYADICFTIPLEKGYRRAYFHLPREKDLLP